MTSMVYHKLKVIILPLIIILSCCYIKSIICILSLNTINNDLSTQLQELPIQQIRTNCMFISTKDGNLHKYSTTNRNKKLWSISLGQALITANITTTKNVTNDVLLLPLDDKLYYYENEKFTPLNIFIKDIVEKTPLSFHDYLLVGNKKSTVMIIDSDTGEIVQQSDKDYNIVNHNSNDKEASYTNNHHSQRRKPSRSLLTVIRVDYMLTCIGKEEKFWDTIYSDIIIKFGNEQAPYAFLPRKDLMKALDHQSDFELNEIMSVHTSENNNLPVKVYDKSFWNNKMNRNSNSYKEFHLVNDDIEFEDYLKWKKEQYSYQINELLWLLIALIANQIKTLIEIYFDKVSLEFTLFMIGIIIIIDRLISLYYESKHNDEKLNKESLISLKADYTENNSTEDYTIKNEEENMALIKEEEAAIGNEENRLIIYNPLTMSLIIDNSNDNGTGLSNLFNQIEIKQFEKERKNQVQVNSYSNKDDNTVVFEVNHTTKVVYQKNEETEKMHQKLQGEIHQVSKRRNSTPMKHFIIDEEANSKGSNTIKKKSRKYTEKNESKESLEIYEEDEIEESILDNDDEIIIKEKTKTKMKKKGLTIALDNTVNQYPNAGSRLEKDFKDYEKIGQGGFGVVLKAKHKIDEEIYAIKIINLKDLDEQNVVSEAKTMTKIHSKHIVEYKTCWFEQTLGNASEFVTSTEDDFSKSYSMSQSVIQSNKKKKLLIPKNNGNSKANYTISKVIKEDIIKEDSTNSIIFGDNTSELNENTIELNKIFADPCSDEEIHETKKINIDFRDDSNIGSKRSSLNKKHLFIENLYFFIQMEYCNGLPLDQFINQHQDAYIPKETIFTFMHQIIKSLDKIHTRGIIHRDIKPANIFVEGDKGIKIGDFGLATEKKKNITSSFLDEQANKSEMVGTPLYLSPEQLARKNYTEKVDIFASGLVLYEMCACFGTLMERRECIQSLKTKRVLNQRLNDEYPIESKIILWMTETKQHNRPSAIELLQSSLFKQWKEIING